MVTDTARGGREGWVRFQHGSFDCVVVSDGMLEMGPAYDNFPGADPEAIARLLDRHYLPADRVRLNQNVLIIDTGNEVIMFDSGVGTAADWGRRRFGSGTGLVVANMRAAGIDPADIDIVAITHAHPDHLWGLVGDDDKRVFPNARVALSRADHDYFADASRVAGATDARQRDQFLGAQRNLGAYADSLLLLEDGAEIAVGVSAILTPGHSPGHVVYKITSLDETIICWGDLCHHEVLLLQQPRWNFALDLDRQAAVDERLRILEMVDKERCAVLAYHFPFPGLGHVISQGDGYGWLPLELPPRRPDAG
jgi:glyoxylase-like metal-dependent hydrolase (beta-lactamase superfamily II)